jgi:tRNA A37 threonylcarbamoyladenosine synthetase subunit TsaC/SUA5/YrdC
MTATRDDVTCKSETPFTQKEIDDAYAVLDRSGLILFKLDIGYGFAGRSEESLRRMYELKGRPESNPCVVPGNMEVLQELCPGIDPAILDWLRLQIPWTTFSVIGNLNAESPIWLSLPEFVRKQCSKNGSVAVFLNAGEFLEALLARSLMDGKLFAGSSANLSGQGNVYRPEMLAPSLIAGVDLFIDHGVARYENPDRMATTMIDLRTCQITRRGVNYAQLAESLARLRNQLSRGAHEQ